jgi:hypothetical protein
MCHPASNPPILRPDTGSGFRFQSGSDRGCFRVGPALQLCNFGLSDLPWPLRSLGHGPQHRGGSWRSPVCAARHPKQPEQPPSRRRNAGQDVDDAEDPGPLLPGERLRHETCGCLCRHGCGRPVPSWPCGCPGGGCRLGQHGHGGTGGSQGDKPCAGTLPEPFIHRLMDTPPPPVSGQRARSHPWADFQTLLFQINIFSANGFAPPLIGSRIALLLPVDLLSGPPPPPSCPSGRTGPIPSATLGQGHRPFLRA